MSTRDRLTGRDWTGVVFLTEYIQPVCLPAAGQALVDGKVCTVTGWGNTQFYGKFQVLRPATPLGGDRSWLRGTRWTSEGPQGHGVGTRRGGRVSNSGHHTHISSGQQAVVLQEARVPIISNEVCNSPDFYGNQIKPKMFCAGYPEGGIDACQVRDTAGQPSRPNIIEKGPG